jgi:hypothetical protein
MQVNVYLVIHSKSREICGAFADLKKAQDFIGYRERDRSELITYMYPIQGMQEPPEKLSKELEQMKEQLRNGVEL